MTLIRLLPINYVSTAHDKFLCRYLSNNKRDLLLHRLEAHEAIGAESHELFYCEAECYSSNSFIEFKDILGQPVEISILRADGSYRLVSGIVTAVAHMGSDGGFTLFKLRIVSAFAILAKRTNCRVFQNMTVPQIVEQISFTS